MMDRKRIENRERERNNRFIFFFFFEDFKCVAKNKRKKEETIGELTFILNKQEKEKKTKNYFLFEKKVDKV